MSQPFSRRRFLIATGTLSLSAGLSACASGQSTPAAPPTTVANPPAAATAAPKPAGTSAPATAETAAPGKSTATTPVKLGFIRGIFDGAYMLAARDAGIYEKNGIAFDLETYQDDVISTRSLLAKEIMVGEISFQNPLSVIEKGQ